jgi:DNA-binding NarL/FixJ family response regulator
MNKKIKVVVADDHVHYRDGLTATLNEDKDIEVVAGAGDAVQLVEIARQYQPDVIITDLIMPGDGLVAIRDLIAQGFLRIIAVSSFEDEDLIVEALEAGATGYVKKNADRDEITEAVKDVYRFRPHYSDSTSPLLMKEILRSPFNPYKKIDPDLFTEMELEVITLICEGKTNIEIAQLLFSSLRNIERIRRDVQKKMKVKRTAGLIIYAIKNGLYKGPAL